MLDLLYAAALRSLHPVFPSLARRFDLVLQPMSHSGVAPLILALSLPLPALACPFRFLFFCSFRLLCHR